MNPLTDTDPMPFGKYKGERMEDVPARYLHWLWTNGLSSKAERKTSLVAKYIEENLAVLMSEYPDGIW